MEWAAELRGEPQKKSCARSSLASGEIYLLAKKLECDDLEEGEWGTAASSFIIRGNNSTLFLTCGGGVWLLSWDNWSDS